MGHRIPLANEKKGEGKLKLWGKEEGILKMLEALSPCAKQRIEARKSN